jgi:hypothetical protein
MGSRAAARIHADRGFVMASSPFPFLASGDLQKQQKRNKPVDFSFFFFVFRSASLYRSVFFPFSVSGGGLYDQEAVGDYASVVSGRRR